MVRQGQELNLFDEDYVEWVKRFFEVVRQVPTFFEECRKGKKKKKKEKKRREAFLELLSLNLDIVTSKSVKWLRN